MSWNNIVLLIHFGVLLKKNYIKFLYFYLEPFNSSFIYFYFSFWNKIVLNFMCCRVTSLIAPGLEIDQNVKAMWHRRGATLTLNITVTWGGNLSLWRWYVPFSVEVQMTEKLVFTSQWSLWLHSRVTWTEGRMRVIMQQTTLVYLFIYFA